MMSSKSRVHAALRREPVDRIPIWMWFHPETTRRLSEILQVHPARVADVMGDDVRQAWVGNNHAMEGIVHQHDGETHTDFWGVQWVKEGPFNQIRYSPLQDKDEKEISDYRYPYEHIEDLLANMAPVAAVARDRFIGCDISPCLFEMVCRIRGMEASLTDLAASPQLSQAMLAQAGDFSVCLAEMACDRFKIDWLWTGDDVGGQQNMIMSPRRWRDLIRPHLARIFAVGKSRGLWVAYHCCGAIPQIIPDLIEIGLDVLNPIQCNCPGMVPSDLKKEYGRVLSFMGGVDTQQLLPNGSEDEVYSATARLVEEMTADGGGYILAASHTVPPETPMENIFAMYRAAGVSPEEIFDRASAIRAETALAPPTAARRGESEQSPAGDRLRSIG
jgi:uroporphyrinogen decarboxylase